jgi:hypothetical protein
MGKTELLNLFKQNLLKIDKKLTSISNMLGGNQSQCNTQNIDDIINIINSKKNVCQNLINKRKKQIGGSNNLLNDVDDKLQKYINAFNELYNLRDRVDSDKKYILDNDRVTELINTMSSIDSSS